MSTVSVDIVCKCGEPLKGGFKFKKGKLILVVSPCSSCMCNVSENYMDAYLNGYKDGEEKIASEMIWEQKFFSGLGFE